MADERLEELLRIVQEEKEKYPGLVGTQDVLFKLRATNELYDLPGKISTLINTQLSRTFSPIAYSATFERVVGISTHVIDITLENLSGRLEKPPEASNPPFYSLAFSSLNPEARYTAVLLFPFFSDANKDGVKNDKDVGISLASTIRRQFDSAGWDLSSTDVSSIVSAVSGFDWGTNLSRDAIFDLQSFEKGLIHDSFYNSDVMFQRIELEQVEHKLEYRRKFLENYLASPSVNVSNWEELREYLDFRISSLKGDVSDPNSHVSRNLSSDRLNSELRLVEFIRRLAGQEKSWLEKYLPN